MPLPLLRSRRLTLTLVALTLLASALLTVTACAPRPSGSEVPASPVPASPAATTGQQAVPRPDHTVVVVLENEDRSKVIGNRSAPYLNALAARGANLTHSYGVTHPSQPNYIALFSGGQHGVTSDACPTNLHGQDNLGAQLRRARLSFTGYSESMPGVGYTGCVSGQYRRKHNPWVNFDLPASTNQPFSAFPSDFTKLPTVAFVTPNMCHDMHDCSLATADTWVRQHLGAYATWATAHNSLLVVTYDENDGGSVNQIPTILVGQRVRPGSYDQRLNHYGLLRTLEDAYGLPALGHAATAAPLSGIWTSAPRPVARGVVNGSFEAGLTGWSRSGATKVVKTVVRSGTYAARVGAASGRSHTSMLSQTVVVPSGRSRLSISWRGSCRDTRSHAWASVVVLRRTSGQVSTPLVRTCTRSRVWHEVHLKVTAGHRYTIQLINRDDDRPATPNRTYFDRVQLT